jgi:2-(1,2-epoxy-1,2-dihydrophenyl)acetyl-CoA isomerase
VSGYQTILYTTDQAVATITLSRPERRNAVTQEMLTELYNAFGRAGDDSAVRAIVLTGAGKGFCAGQDLSAFAGISSSEQVRTAVLDYYKPLIRRMCALEKPILGAINGAAAGAGTSLALACDLRIMADDAYLLQAFSNIGLVPDAGSCWFLVRLVGYSRAFEIAGEGERVFAQRCLELGLTNRIAPAASLFDAAQAWAQRLAQSPTLALGLTKRAMMAATHQDLEAIIHLEAELQGTAVQSYDHREGVTAFLDKRQPAFQGR